MNRLGRCCLGFVEVRANDCAMCALVSNASLPHWALNPPLILRPMAFHLARAARERWCLNIHLVEA
jgi:hypothetical protein